MRKIGFFCLAVYFVVPKVKAAEAELSESLQELASVKQRLSVKLDKCRPMSHETISTLNGKLTGELKANLPFKSPVSGGVLMDMASAIAEVSPNPLVSNFWKVLSPLAREIQGAFQPKKPSTPTLIGSLDGSIHGETKNRLELGEVYGCAVIDPERVGFLVKHTEALSDQCDAKNYVRDLEKISRAGKALAPKEAEDLLKDMSSLRAVRERIDMLVAKNAGKLSADELKSVEFLLRDYDDIKNIQIGITDLTARSPKKVQVEQWNEVTARESASVGIFGGLAGKTMAGETRKHHESQGASFSSLSWTGTRGFRNHVLKRPSSYTSENAGKEFGKGFIALHEQESLKIEFSPPYDYPLTSRKKWLDDEFGDDNLYGAPIPRGYCESPMDLPKVMSKEYPVFFLGHPSSCLWSCAVNESESKNDSGAH